MACSCSSYHFPRLCGENFLNVILIFFQSPDGSCTPVRNVLNVPNRDATSVRHNDQEIADKGLSLRRSVAKRSDGGRSTTRVFPILYSLRSLKFRSKFRSLGTHVVACTDGKLRFVIMTKFDIIRTTERRNKQQWNKRTTKQ